MSISVKEVDEDLFDEEIHLCLPPKDSPKYGAFDKGIKDKNKWLKKRLVELGSVAQIAYQGKRPIAFIEYVSAEKAPVPTNDDRKTALITCIHKPESKEKGVGTLLVSTALQRLKQLGIEQVKTLVIRDPHWITGGVYFKNGFQLEKTFYKPGESQPLDLLTLNLKGKQEPITQPTILRFEASVSNCLPIGITHFVSGQCPFTALIQAKLARALEKFDAKYVVLEVLDTWEHYRLGREYGAMHSDLYINGRVPFLGPASQEEIEKEIRKEIERVRVPG